MALDLPALNHRRIEQPPLNRRPQQYPQRQTRHPSHKRKNRQPRELRERRAEVRGQMAGLVEPVEALEKERQKRPEGDVGEDEEAEEVWEGLERDAVAGPRAVVVHLWDAAATGAAVVRARGFRGAAFSAPAADLRASRFPSCPYPFSCFFSFFFRIGADGFVLMLLLYVRWEDVAAGVDGAGFIVRVP